MKQQAQIGKIEWREVELKDVCDLITDGTHQTPKYVDVLQFVCRYS